ncbi:expressed unknown protein [Seminavis robusta]|uniref:Uncharacterized protein n=1 Tax=Seminavis robusta TaxID=568900 RepID=A0A9N8HD33_9STRA|nr:expressed unknown protein [Seminavis robusta]|eukprot:Sro244_g097090.1 n/a (769) ;mRNA; f:15573-18162
MELPFAVESPERTSQLLQPTSLSAGDVVSDDGSSLVTASSQGSFLTSASGMDAANGPSAFAHRPPPPPHHHPQPTTAHINPPMATVVPSHHTARPVVQPVVAAHGHPAPLISPSPPSRAPPVVAPPMPTSAPRPSGNNTSRTGSGGITSGLNIFGNLRVFGSSKPSSSKQQQQHTDHTEAHKTSLETIDFTYVNVCETDADDEVDITLSGQLTAIDGPLGGETEGTESKRDILTLLLSGAVQQDGDADNESLVRQCEEAHQAACMAAEAKREGDLQGALEAHTRAAKQFHAAALIVKDRNVPMANSLLLLSQTQAKSALALKRIVKQSPIPHDSNPADAKNPRSKIITHKDRLRAAVRGALVTRNNEEEMSDSAFLGKATKGPMTSVSGSSVVETSNSRSEPSTAGPQHNNPVDDMMELERQLRDMDLALELGNSIASLDARTQSRLKSSSIGVDGSFMVVPGSQSYMSSSNMWAPTPSAPSHASNTGATSARNNPKAATSRTAATPGTAGVRARANRVQNLLGASTNYPRSPSHGQLHQPTHPHNRSTVAPAPPPSGLESSWWGTSSTTSQVLTSSVISLGASCIRPGPGQEGGGADSPANTKQLMRLMDALKTLGDENANLLREVEEAEAARMEGKAAKEQMAKFKQEYSKRFEHLKAALKKFRENNPETGGGEANLVTSSDYMRTASTTDQLVRQEQLIRKLTDDLKQAKEESKKKDMALQKYENFYREVKARSAAKQRQRETGGVANSQRPPQPKTGSRRAGHR